MNYEKKELETYGLHTIQTDKFKTITIKINFKRKIKKEDITKRNLLSEILSTSCGKYHTERLLALKIEDLYGLGFNSYAMTSGNYGILGFTFKFLTEKYTEDSIIPEIIDFMKEIIFHPDIKDNAFSEENFLMAKKRILDEIDAVMENPNQYGVNRLYDLMAENSIISYHPEGDPKILESLDAKQLYTFYQDIIQNDIVDIFVLGDIQESLKESIMNSFEFGCKNIRGESHYVNDIPIREDVKIVTEKSHFTQSKMYLSYNLVNITDFERDYVSYVYSAILGGGGDSKLFKKVREENSLCYTISSFVNRIFGILNIRLGFDYKNYDQVLENIQSCLEEMEKGNFEEEEIKKAKILYKNSLKEIFDSPVRILNLYISKEYLNIEPIDQRLKNIEKVDKTMIMEFAKKIKANMIYCLEGREDHEKDSE